MNIRKLWLVDTALFILSLISLLLYAVNFSSTFIMGLLGIPVLFIAPGYIITRLLFQGFSRYGPNLYIISVIVFSMFTSLSSALILYYTLGYDIKLNIFLVIIFCIAGCLLLFYKNNKVLTAKDMIEYVLDEFREILHVIKKDAPFFILAVCLIITPYVMYRAFPSPEYTRYTELYILHGTSTSNTDYFSDVAVNGTFNVSVNIVSYEGRRNDYSLKIWIDVLEPIEENLTAESNIENVYHAISENMTLSLNTFYYMNFSLNDREIKIADISSVVSLPAGNYTIIYQLTISGKEKPLSVNEIIRVHD